MVDALPVSALTCLTMTKPIPTQTALQHAGGTVKLAEIFGIKHNAVSQWGEFIPTSRTYELREKRPDWFYKNGNIKPPPLAS